MTKLSRERGKDTILIIQDDALEMIYLVLSTEKANAEQV
jgi:hypothetical protein